MGASQPTRSTEELYTELDEARRHAWTEAKDRGEVSGKYTPAKEPETDGPFQLPSGWTWVTVDQITYDLTYGTSSKTTEDPTGVPVLRMGNIVNGTLDFSNLKYLPPDHPEFPHLLLRDGDLLFNRTNSPELVGKSAVYQGRNRLMSFASYLIRVRTVQYDPQLLAWYLNSPHGRAWARDNVTQQVGQANLNGTKLRSLMIPYPPNRLQGQRHIVDQIENAMERVRRARGALKTIAQLQPLGRLSTLTTAFTGQVEYKPNPPLAGLQESPLAAPSLAKPLFHAPEHWLWTTLPSVSNMILGKMLDKSKPTRGRRLPYLRNINVRWQSFDLSDLSEMDFDERETQRFELYPGDVLVCEGGEPGRAAVWRERSTDLKFQKALHRLRPNAQVIKSEWIVYYLWYLASSGGLEEFFTGTTIKHLTQVGLAKIPIPLPPIAEQEELCAYISSSLRRFHIVSVSTLSVTSQIDQLETSILAEAFIGNLK